MEKRELSYTVGWNITWYSHYGKQVWSFLKKLKVELPYDPAIPLLCIHKDESKTPKRYMYLYIPCSTIYNSQDVETTKCPPTEE